MHVVTRLLGITVLIMIGTAIMAFTSVLELPVTADGFFTLRDVIEEIVFPIVFAVANYRIYVHLQDLSPSRLSDGKRLVVNLAEIVLLAGIVIASLAVGVRFVGDELTTNFCSGAAMSVGWCQKAQLFHKELGHLGLFLGNILNAAGLLICQLCRSEAEDLDRVNLISVGLLGGLGGLGLFALVIEGRIIAIGLPLLAVYTVATTLAWRERRAELRRLPVLSYQTNAAWVALVFVAVWVIYWRGFPDFAMVSRTLAR